MMIKINLANVFDREPPYRDLATDLQRFFKSSSDIALFMENKGIQKDSQEAYEIFYVLVVLMTENRALIDMLLNCATKMVELEYVTKHCEKYTLKGDEGEEDQLAGNFLEHIVCKESSNWQSLARLMIHSGFDVGVHVYEKPTHVLNVIMNRHYHLVRYGSEEEKRDSEVMKTIYCLLDHHPNLEVMDKSLEEVFLEIKRVNIANNAPKSESFVMNKNSPKL